ncbi:hypothetical protein TW80_16495 [Loktanella sp. S4079]|nr:hypothetical protein TW80_16495 [Loktanella sp. S4079]
MNHRKLTNWSQVWKPFAENLLRPLLYTDLHSLRLFLEVVIQEDAIEPEVSSEIVLRSDQIEVSLPVFYPVSNLVSVIQALSRFLHLEISNATLPLFRRTASA